MTVKCAKCQFHFITHDASQPWGCRRFGFKSKNLPNYEVKNATGIECAYFKLKKHNKSVRKMDKYGNTFK